MTENTNVLIIEDSPDDATLVVYELKKGGLAVTHERVDTADGMKDALARKAWDIILCDYNIPNFGAMKALALTKELGVTIPFIIISGVIGEETAVNAMRAGAHDFIVKGEYARLVPAVKREIEEYVLRQEQMRKIQLQTDEAQKQKQLAFTMMMQNPQPLILVNTDLHIKIANQAFLELSGISEEKLQSMSIRDFRVLEKTGHNIREALETRKGVTGDVVVDFPTGVHYLEQHTIPLLDKDRNIVALMAVYKDNTEKRKLDTAKKELAEYQAAYFRSLSDGLTNMAGGNLDFDLTLEQPNENTRTAYEEFTVVNTMVGRVRKALQLMIVDANMLSEAAVAGNLETRADASRHNGDFRKIIDGVNRTLDSVILPVNEAMRISDEYANRNLTVRFDESLQVHGDFIRFKNSLNNVGIQVSKAMLNMNREVSKLAAGAKEASASVRDVSAGAGQIARNAGAVSTNTGKSGEGIRQVLNAMEELSSTVQEVATKADNVARISKKSEELSKNGTELANRAERGMEGITKSSKEVNEIILDIKAQMDQIGDIVVLIGNIANQTNLLALNAAIEAARAGDAGRGFAVVAAEVKALAQQSKGSTEKIRQMISDLQKQTQRAVEGVEKSGAGVREGSAALTQTLEVFNRIVTSIDEINTNISDVAASAEEQAASVEEVTASVHSVNNLVENTAKEAAAAAAASKESSTAIEQISDLVENVTTIVDSVTMEIAAFRVDDESGGHATNRARTSPAARAR
jgi:methyl-accepting chemotaxis protein